MLILSHPDTSSSHNSAKRHAVASLSPKLTLKQERWPYTLLNQNRWLHHHPNQAVAVQVIQDFFMSSIFLFKLLHNPRTMQFARCMALPHNAHSQATCRAFGPGLTHRFVSMADAGLTLSTLTDRSLFQTSKRARTPG